MQGLMIRLFSSLTQIVPAPNVIKLKENPFAKPLFSSVRDLATMKPIDLIAICRNVFGAPLRQDIIYRAVVWYRASIRAGTACTKARGDVSGTGRKAANQKGRGEARVGTLRAPHRRGGIIRLTSRRCSFWS